MVDRNPSADSLDGDPLASVSSKPFRKLGVVAALIGVVGAAWWMFGRDKGQPEDPARVLIIGPTPELVDFLDRKGFDPEHLSFGAAIGEGKAHDPSLDDVAAVIEHADQQGIGYVAFDLAHGQTYDFASADYEVGEPPPGSTFVVLAVGKLGKQVSFGGVIPGIEHRPPYDEQAGLMLALFGQTELAKARTNAAINDLMVRFGGGRTIDDLEAYEKAQTNMRRQIAAWEALPERERGGTKPIELARPYEPVVGWALANEAVLLASGRGAWRSKNALDSEWSGEDLTAELAVVRLESESTDRSPCPTLPDTLRVDGGFVVGPAGDALLIPSDRWVANLWVLTDDGCGFEERSPIRRLANGELGKPRASGRTAEVLDGALMWADAKMQAYRTLRLPGIELHERSLVWLADDVVGIPVTLDFAEAASARAERMAQAAAAALPAGEPAPEAPLPAIDPSTLPANRDALVLVRLPASKQKDVIEVAVVSFELGQSARAITAIGTGDSAIVELEGPEGTRLVRATLPLAELAWSDALLPEFDLGAALGPSPSPSKIEPLATLPNAIHDLVISPSGKHAAWTAEFDDPVGEDPKRAHEIVVLTFAAGQPTRLTVNDFADSSPRFGGKAGEFVIFSSTRMAAEDLPAVTTLRALRAP